MIIKNKYKIIALIVIFFVGIFARIYRFPNVPAGFNQDEALTGYEAFSLLSTGRDTHGHKWPCHFEGFGGGESAIHSYLDIPFVAIFGLNIFSERIVNLLLGILALFIFGYLVGKTNNFETKLIAAFLLAITPWHIMSNRWGHDAYLFPNIFLISATFFCKGLKRPAFLIIGALLCSLSLYSYASAHLFVPVFILLFLIYYRKALLKNKISLICSILVFSFIALPIGVFLAKNILPINTASIENYIPFSIPKLPRPRAVSLLSYTSSVGWGKMIIRNLRIILGQYDGLPFNAIKGLGTIYLISIPFFLLGIVKGITSGHDKQNEKIFLIWLISAFLIFFFIPININRISILWFPLVYYTAYGIKDFAYKFKDLKYEIIMVISSLYIAFFSVFLNTYFHKYSQENIISFEKNLDFAVNYIFKNTTEEVYITDSIIQPYIYILFFGKYNPLKFQQISTPYYEKIKKFDRFNIFNVKKEGINNKFLSLIRKDELDYIIYLNKKYHIVKDFDTYKLIRLFD